MSRQTTALLATASLIVALLFFVARPRPAAEDSIDPFLGPPRHIAPGVSLYHVTESDLVRPPASLSIWILKVDLALADLRPALAHDEIMRTETVPDIAARHGAVAAINAGFFLKNGDPQGVYKIDGQLVSEARRPRGAVGIIRNGTQPRLIFGRVSAGVTLRILQPGRPPASVDIAGVDTTRLLGRLMLFTPRYHAHTDTARGGLEWVIGGSPLRVTGPPRSEGSTPIPREGFVLSFGGPRAPPALAGLEGGTEVVLETRYEALEGPVEGWAGATDVIGGAGLLVRDGQFVEGWSEETFAAGFEEHRHPRTMIGTREDGSVWLVAVDGRQPQLSAGMTLGELQELARRLRLANAVNLDGGGSTTMWVDGDLVNSPSDPTGARDVSDALLVIPRQ